MTQVDDHHIHDVLADLVAHDVISTDQARAVADALEAEAVAAPRAPVRARPAAHSPAEPSTLRARLVEAAAYLGAVLVAAGVLALVAQSWSDMTVGAQVAVLAGIGTVLYLAGLAAALVVGGGAATVRLHGQGPRRRVASALLTTGAVLAASAVPASADGSARSMCVAALVVLLVLVPAEVLAPSALTELALAGAAAIALSSGLGLLVPERPYDDSLDTDGGPSARAWDFLVPVAVAVLGLAWAWFVSRVLTVPVLATVVGLSMALIAAVSLAVDSPTRTGGVVLLGVLAVLGVAAFVRLRSWPWLLLTVLAATVAVFVLVAHAANPALAFLVSGVVLLVTAGGGALLGRRTAAAPGA